MARILCVMHCILLAMVLVLCGHDASRPSPVEVAATCAAGGLSPARCAPAQECSAPTPGPILQLKAVEADADNGNPICDVCDDASTAVDGIPSWCVPRRMLRGEAGSDPSRFAMGAALPRGPPV